MLRMLERIARSLLTTGGAIALAGVGLMLIFLGAELFGTVGAIAGIFLAALLVGWVRVMAESIASPKVLVRKTVAMSTRILDATLWLKERLRPKGEAKPKLVAPPAMRIARFLEFVCSPLTYEEVVVPIIADMQAHYFEFLNAKRPWKARMEYLRGLINLGRQLGLFSLLDWLFSAVKRLTKK